MRPVKPLKVSSSSGVNRSPMAAISRERHACHVDPANAEPSSSRIFERFAECNAWFHAVLSWNGCGVRIVFEIAIPEPTDG